MAKTKVGAPATLEDVLKADGDPVKVKQRSFDGPDNDETRVGKVGKEEIVVKSDDFVAVGVDMSAERVLELDGEKKKLLFDPDHLVRLDDEVVRQLSRYNKDQYVRAQIVNKYLNDRKRAKTEVPFVPTDPLRLITDIRAPGLRVRAGWHQTTCRDDEFDAFMAAGYRPVRVPTEAQKEKGFKAGEESGSVFKIREGVSANGMYRYSIAVEIPTEIYEQHLKAISYLNQSKYLRHEDALRAYLEGRSRDVGARLEVLQTVTESENVEGAEKLGTWRD